MCSVLFCACGGALLGQRPFRLGAGIDFSAAAYTNPQINNLTITRQGFAQVFGVTPSISLGSTTSHTDFQFAYGFGYNQVGSGYNIVSRSHFFTGSFSASPTKNLRLNFSESYSRSPDFFAFNLLRGIIFTPEGFYFAYDTLLLRRSSSVSAASAGLDYTITPNSSLSFSAAHFLQDYQVHPLFTGSLSDQDGFTGSVRYTRRFTARASCEIGYTLSQFHFRDFSNARSHSATVGVTYQLTPTVSVLASGGAAYTRALSSTANFVGYLASASVSKLVRSDQFALSYSHSSATATGIGSVSDAHSMSFQYSRSLARKLRVEAGLAGHKTDPRLDNTVRTRGVSGTASLNLAVTDRWSVNVGTTYSRYKGTQLFDLGRKGVIVSLRFADPELWRTGR